LQPSTMTLHRITPLLFLLIACGGGEAPAVHAGRKSTPAGDEGGSSGSAGKASARAGAGGSGKGATSGSEANDGPGDPMSSGDAGDPTWSGDAGDPTPRGDAGDPMTNGGVGGSTPIGEPEDLSSRALLSPDRVYLFGELTEGQCGTYAIADIEAPNQGLVGFDCYISRASARIDPKTGRMFYQVMQPNGVREFHCDSHCVYPSSADGYPLDPAANDPLVSNLSCAHTVGLEIGPDGAMAYQCFDATETVGGWYDADGNLLYMGDAYIRHLGYDWLAFATGKLVDFKQHTEIPIVGLPDRTVHAIRAIPDGFYVALAGEGLGEDQLWKVVASGEATMLGSYAAPPAGLEMWLADAALTPDGALFQATRRTGTFDDFIIRRTIDGTSEVVYTETDKTIVKMHASPLFTGP
jgi:hypothetical protein